MAAEEGSTLRSVARALRSLQLIGEAGELGAGAVSERLGYVPRRRTG
jgi:hypothetical protein